MRSISRGSQGFAALVLMALALSVAAAIATPWFGSRAAAEEGEAAGRSGRPADGTHEEGILKVGDLAPDFTLATADGKSTVTLSRFRDRKPVVLLFGSYSCPTLRRQLGGFKQIYEHYKDLAEFLLVYIEEAHAADAVALPENQDEGVNIAQHKTLDDRCEAAAWGVDALGSRVRVAVDTMDNHAQREYAAWPVRLYVVGADGRIAYQGNTTPERFTLAELSGPLERELEAATEAENVVLAPGTRSYNCIAHSLGIHDCWVNPETGPPDAPLSRMDQIYAAFGYQRLPEVDLSLQPGKQKIVVYLSVQPDGDGNKVTHATVQESDGTWSSKCGAMALVRHETPYSLPSSIYGLPAAVYMRDAS